MNNRITKVLKETTMMDYKVIMWAKTRLSEFKVPNGYRIDRFEEHRDSNRKDKVCIILMPLNGDEPSTETSNELSSSND